MNFGELQTQVSNKVGYNDQSEKIPTYINSAIHQLEQEDDWPHMETRATGNLTSSQDYIAIPSKYKNVVTLKITDSDQEIFLRKGSYETIINLYPFGITSKACLKRFAKKKSESNFIVRPYPDKTYAYELISNNYSTDLSASSDTNYWTDENWEIVMYGALIQWELDSGSKLTLGTEEVPLSPALLYANLLRILRRNRTTEKYTNGVAYASSVYAQ